MTKMQFKGFSRPYNQQTGEQMEEIYEEVRVNQNYRRLFDILVQALNQAQSGKGAERHAKGEPFEEQRMQTISKLIDSERGMAYQATKKMVEGLDLPTHQARVKELLGAINYIAGIIIYLEDKEKATPVERNGDICQGLCAFKVNPTNLRCGECGYADK